MASPPCESMYAITLAESAARGALAMSWFHAASVASAGARGEREDGGAGNTGHEPRAPEGGGAAAPAGPADASATQARATAAARIAAPTHVAGLGPGPAPRRAAIPFRA